MDSEVSKSFWGSALTSQQRGYAYVFQVVTLVLAVAMALECLDYTGALGTQTLRGSQSSHPIRSGSIFGP